MLWGIKKRSRNRLDGYREWLAYGGDCTPIIFSTKYEADRFIKMKYSEMYKRPDLRAEPHGWLMPVPCKVEVTIK